MCRASYLLLALTLPLAAFGGVLKMGLIEWLSDEGETEYEGYRSIYASNIATTILGKSTTMQIRFGA
jgi:hypothetical protein